MTTTTTWRGWHHHFASNARRPLPKLPSDLDALPAGWRGALASSLARFQLGEAGEGRIAREIDHATLAGIDDDYRAALKLFVREEGRHARILALLVRGLGGTLLHKQWTERCFVAVRRCFGLRCKLLVLLAAEVVGLGFYGILADRLGSCATAAVLREISNDEAMHLEFHAAFFRGHIRSGVQRQVFRIGWWMLAGACCLGVLADHRRSLKALEVAPTAVLRRFFRLLVRVDRAVLGSGQAKAPAQATGCLPGDRHKPAVVHPGGVATGF